MYGVKDKKNDSFYNTKRYEYNKKLNSPLKVALSGVELSDESYIVNPQEIYDLKQEEKQLYNK